MSVVPVVEPAAPEFTAHQRLIGLELFEILEMEWRTGTEVCDTEQMRQSAAAQHPAGAAVRSEEQAVDAVVTVDFFHFQQVILIVAVAAVLVFHLHHHDAAAVGTQVRADAGEQLLIIGTDFFQIERVVAAQRQVRVGEQPAWQTTELPFGADVRPRTNDDIQIQLFRDGNKALDIQSAAEIKLSFFSLVKIPAGIGFNSIETAGFQLFQAVFPVFGQNTEVVQRAGNNTEGLAVQKELIVIDGQDPHDVAVLSQKKLV